MNKKDLKMYETPTVEVLDIDLENQILAGTTTTDTPDVPIEQIPDDHVHGF